MTTQINNQIETTQANKTIVAFHIGRGGQFYNAGHKTFVGTHDINHFTDDLFLRHENAYNVFDKINGRPNLEGLYYDATDWNNVESIERLKAFGLDLGKKVWFDAVGNEVELTEEETNSGVGCINIDNDYDTTYTKYLEDCSEEEIDLIADSTEWNRDQLLVELAEIKGFSPLQIKLMAKFEDVAEVLKYDSPERYSNDFEAHEVEPEDEDYLEFGGKFYTQN